MSDKKITVTTTPKNRIVVNKGGSYSGIDTLVELRDVDAVNKKDNDVLVFEAANNKFVIKEVPFVNSSFQTANAAFDKANAANVLAYTVSINANAWANTKVSSVTGTSGQIYSSGGTTPTLNLIATGVTARTYGAANQIPVITVDAFGRLTSAANVAVEGMNYVYANLIGAASNAWANTVGTAGNNYSIAVGASSNAWTNSINVYSDATYFRRSGGTISGSVTVVGNLGITGNLAVTGNTYFISTENYRVSDPLIYLAGNNYISDIVDIGFIANYVNTTGANVHTGLYREHENKEWYLFQGYDKEPDNNHIGAFSNNMTLAVLNSDLRTSNLTLGGTNAISWITSAFSKANNALANTSDVSFNGNLYFPTGSISIGNVAPSGALHISKALTRAILLNRPEIGTTVTDGAYIGIGGTVADGFGFINQETGPIKFGTSDTERMRITGAGDVGIGTSSPAYTLDVNGVIQAQSTGSASMIINPASGNYAQLLLQNAGTTRWRIRHNDTEDYLSFYDERKTGGAGSQLVIKDTTGHVGLGMTTPNAKFSILSSGIGFAIHDTAGANFLRGLSISTSDASGYSYINAGDGTGWKMFLGTGSASYNSNNIRLAITDNGIGIGTTSPSSKLQVNGTITIANTGPVESFRSGANNITLNMYNEANGTLSWEGSAGQLFSITNDLTGSIFSVNDVSGIPSIDVNANGNISLAQFSGNVGIGTSNPVYKLDVNGDARITGNLTLGDATTDTITVNAANFNLANNVSFDSGTLFIDKNNDRIGIGTTSPATTLDISGTTSSVDRTSLILRVPVAAENYSIKNKLAFMSATNIVSSIDAQFPTGASGPPGNLIFNVLSGYPAGNLNEIMRLTGAGNVGIGTTSPQTKLHVTYAGTDINGTPGQYISGADRGSFIGFAATATGGKTWAVGSTSDTHTVGGSKFALTLLDTNSTKLVVDANGNVGIGTSSPTVKLHVAGDAIFTGNVTVSGNTTYMNTQTLLIGDNLITLNADLPNNLPATEDAGIEVNRGAYGNASIVWDETNDRWDIRANGNNLVSILSTGNVGIGTTTAAAKLTVSDGAFGRDGAARFGVDNTWYGQLDYDFQGASLNFRSMGNTIDRNINFYVAGTNALKITGTGNIGIGTTSPSEILTVSKSSSGVTVFPHLFLENLDGTDGGVRFYADGDGGGGIITFGSKVSTFAVANGRPSHLTTDHPGRKAGIFNYQNGTTNDASAFLFGNSDAGTNQPIGWKVAITANGRVGVGTTSPNSTLHVVGTANITSGIVTTGDITTTGTMTAQHFDNVSDITLKENIEPIQDALNTLEKLNPVSFTWKKDGSTSFGLIAQEVEKILPEIVHQSDEVKTVSYTQIISLLIAAIKELNTKLDDLT